MATIITRAGKEAPLTNAEVDSNFTNLNTDKAETDGATLTNVDINSGAIDGVTIGGASAGAGTFTTLQADTSLNVDGTVTADGLTVDTNTLYVDASADAVGIATTDPVENFSVGATQSSAGFSLGYADTQVFLRYNNYFSGTAQVSDATKGSASMSLGRSSDGVITFWTAAAGAGTPSERMRIDSSGNLLVGTDLTPGTLPTTTTDTGFATGLAGLTTIVRSGGTVIEANRLASDGPIINFRKDGATVGSIGVYATTDTYITGGTGNDHGIVIGDGYVVPSGANGGTNSNVDLGLAGTGRRFKDLYLSGGVYLGGTGSANHLDDYEEGTWTPAWSFATSGSASSLIIGHATYTKIGQIVTISTRFFTQSTSSPSGKATITGIPFASADSEASGSIGLMLRFGTDMPNIKARVNGSSIEIGKAVTTSVTNDFLEGSDFNLAGGNQNIISVCITYRTS